MLNQVQHDVNRGKKTPKACVLTDFNKFSCLVS